MFRILFAASFLALMGGTALLAEPQLVKQVEVTIGTDAIQNEKAAARYLTLPGDLNKAILTRLGAQMGDKGARVLIDLTLVELANTYQTAFGIADSKLVGEIIVRNADSDLEMHRYTLTVAFPEAGPFLPKGVDIAAITSDSPEYYRAMVDAFADRVVANLQ